MGSKRRGRLVRKVEVKSWKTVCIVPRLDFILKLVGVMGCFDNLHCPLNVFSPAIPVGVVKYKVERIKAAIP